MSAEPSIIEQAREAFEAGERGLAEAICRVRLACGASGEEASGASRLLARIAGSVGRGDVEAEYLGKAGDSARNVPPAPAWKDGGPEKILPRREDAAPPPEARRGIEERGVEERVLLIRGWGQGFWADVDHVLGQCLLAEITGRTPLVWWGAESRFGDGVANAWERYFEPVSGVGFEDVVERAGRGGDSRALTFFPARWNAGDLREVHLPLLDPPSTRVAPVDVLERREDVVVSTMHGSMAMILPWTRAGHWLHGASIAAAFAGLARKYLKPTRRIVERVDAAHEAMFARHQRAGGRVVAVHLRGCDKAGEDPVIGASRERAMARVAEIVGAKGQDDRWRVLVLTDWEPMVAECRARFGERTMFADVRRASGEVGLHFDRGRDGPALGDEVVTDVLLATRCDAFVGVGSSNVSTAVSYLKDWNGVCELIGERYFERANPWVYLR